MTIKDFMSSQVTPPSADLIMSLRVGVMSERRIAKGVEDT
jgi:hypothetical protein